MEIKLFAYFAAYNKYFKHKLLSSKECRRSNPSSGGSRGGGGGAESAAPPPPLFRPSFVFLADFCLFSGAASRNLDSRPPPPPPPFSQILDPPLPSSGKEKSGRHLPLVKLTELNTCTLIFFVTVILFFLHYTFRINAMHIMN